MAVRELALSREASLDFVSDSRRSGRLMPTNAARWANPIPRISRKLELPLLPRYARRAIVGEALDRVENRIGIEVRLGNDIRFEPAREPLVIPVGGERVLVGQFTDVTERPHPSRSAGNEHQVLSGAGRQHGV